MTWHTTRNAIKSDGELLVSRNLTTTTRISRNIEFLLYRPMKKNFTSITEKKKNYMHTFFIVLPEQMKNTQLKSAVILLSVFSSVLV